MPAPPLPADHRAALEAAGVDPDVAVPIGEGWFAVAYRAGDTAVRVLKPRTVEAGWSERYATEVRLLRLLEARRLPVPHDARAVLADDGRLLATAHRYVDGHATSEFPLTDRRRLQVAAHLAAFLTALHAVPLAEARATGLPDLDLATELYTPLIEEALSLVRRPSQRWLQARLYEFRDGGGSAGAARVLLHGDLGPQHILVDADGALRGVIDFGDAMIGDPAFDFAGLGNDYSWPFARLVLASYRGPAHDDPDLHRRAAFYADVVSLYDVVFGARLGDATLLASGRRQVAARAAAASRAAR